jgi:hypothetical protein
VFSSQELWHQRTAMDQLTSAGALHPGQSAASAVRAPQPRPGLFQFAELSEATPSSAAYPVVSGQSGRDLLMEVRRQFAQLATRCMASDPDQRPSFDEATLQLDRMRRNLAIATGAV